MFFFCGFIIRFANILKQFKGIKNFKLKEVLNRRHGTSGKLLERGVKRSWQTWAVKGLPGGL